MAFDNNNITGNINTYATPRVTTKELDADTFSRFREVIKEVVPTWDENNLVGMLELTDRAVVAGDIKFSHYEDSLLLRSVAIDTVVGTPSATSAVVTLTAGSYTPEGGKTRSPLMAGNTLMLADGVQVYVTQKSSNSPKSGMALTPTGELTGTPNAAATEYTLVRATGSSANVGTLVTALASSKAKLAIPTNAFAEGTYQPIEGLKRSSPRYEGTMQIFKAHQETTGTADSLRKEFAYNGIAYYFNEQMIDGLLYDKAQKNYAIMYNPGGSYVDANGDEVRTTMGLEGHIKTRGVNYSYTAGSFSLADLTAITGRIKAIRGGNEYFWMVGAELRGDIETVIRPLPAAQAIRYTNWGQGDGAKKAVDLGINSFTFNGVTFHFMEMALHPEVDGLSTYDYAATGYLIPAEAQSINFEKNGMMTRADIPAATLRYLQQAGGDGSRRFDSWEGGRKDNNGRDVRTWDCLSELGLQITSARKFIRVRPA